MKIAIGSDHGGYELKRIIKNQLIAGRDDYTHFDVGSYSENSIVDYPDISKDVTTLVIHQGYDYGILICGTGQGMVMSANKNLKIRAGLCVDDSSAKLARQHNNCNILCLGGRITGHATALNIVDAFLNTEFEGGRHLERINKFSKI